MGGLTAQKSQYSQSQHRNRHHRPEAVIAAARLAGSRLRNLRSFGDGSANGSNRPEGDLPAWPYERAVSSRKRSSAEAWVQPKADMNGTRVLLVVAEIRKCPSPSRMHRVSYCRVWREKGGHWSQTVPTAELSRKSAVIAKSKPVAIEGFARGTRINVWRNSSKCLAHSRERTPRWYRFARHNQREPAAATRALPTVLKSW
jgi:hypothetical protein